MEYSLSSASDEGGRSRSRKILSHHDPTPNDLQDFLGLSCLLLSRGFVVRRDVGEQKHKKALSAGVSHRKLFIDLDMPRDEICIREPAESVEKLAASTDADVELLTQNIQALLPRFVLPFAN